MNDFLNPIGQIEFMKSWYLLILVIIIVTVVVSVFVFHSPTIQPVQRADDTGTTHEGVSNVINASNQFAFDLYSRLKDENQGKNIFFSPYSISTALSMVDDGASGKTAEEIHSVFHFPVDDSIRRSSYAAVYNELNPANVDYKLLTANALWIQKDFPILKSYTNTIEKYYVGKATNLDFAGGTEQARNTINSWVEDQTNNKIKDLFPPGSLTSLTRLVLTNAIYFKGDWVKQFDKSLTKNEDFRVGEGTTVKIPMMQRTDEKAIYNYTETNEIQILEMLYKGGKLSMLVLLPKSDDLNSLEKSLSLEKLNELRSNLSEQRVDVYMPKFTFSTKYTLNDDLTKMGMPSAFNPNTADFSGIDGARDLFIQIVIHQAFVSVDEQGTEAAAATGVGVGMAIAPQHKIFRADHPFIFIIQDIENGDILFLGRVANPSS